MCLLERTITGFSKPQIGITNATQKKNANTYSL